MVLTSALHQAVWHVLASDLSACSYTWGGNSISGTCYQSACLEDCTIDGNDCANTNSVCQATGVIGDGATDYVCVPSNTFTADNTCPTGTHEKDMGDGTYQCVAPSGVACVGKADLDSCAYTWGSNSITGTCYQGACLEDCTSAGNDCANTNSVCQATGVIGDPSTDYVCVPSNTFTASGTCQRVPMRSTWVMAPSSASHRMPWAVTLQTSPTTDRRTCPTLAMRALTLGAIIPSLVSATALALPPAEPLACVATCTPATRFGSSGTMCTNTNSTCQATGIIGDGSTFGVCIPNNCMFLIHAASDCPAAEPMRLTRAMAPLIVFHRPVLAATWPTLRMMAQTWTMLVQQSDGL